MNVFAIDIIFEEYEVFFYNMYLGALDWYCYVIRAEINGKPLAYSKGAKELKLHVENQSNKTWKQVLEN